MAKTSLNSGAIYGASRYDSLLWRQWEDEFIVYDPASGDTHLLDLLSAELLKSFENGPATLLEISSRVSIQCEVIPDEEFIQRIGKMLEKLCEMSLVEATPC